MMFRVSHPNIRLFAVQNKIENTILVYPVPSAGRRRFSHSAQWLTPYGPSRRLEGLINITIRAIAAGALPGRQQMTKSSA